MADYIDERHRMVARQLRARDIHDERVLAAIERVPRERFVLPELREGAYDDRALPIGCDQTISQPYIVALMTQELRLNGTENVLEIGTGSGYQTAILAELAAEVYTIERLLELSLRARAVLDARGYENIHFTVGDGSLGWPEHAPYDRIIGTAAAPHLPPALFDQLAQGGTLVLPIGDEHEQTITVVHKVHGEPQTREICPCRFVKLVGRQAWPE